MEIDALVCYWAIQDITYCRLTTASNRLALNRSGKLGVGFPCSKQNLKLIYSFIRLKHQHPMKRSSMLLASFDFLLNLLHHYYKKTGFFSLECYWKFLTNIYSKDLGNILMRPKCFFNHKTILLLFSRRKSRKIKSWV